MHMKHATYHTSDAYADALMLLQYLLCFVRLHSMPRREEERAGVRATAHRASAKEWTRSIRPWRLRATMLLEGAVLAGFSCDHILRSYLAIAPCLCTCVDVRLHLMHR